MANNESDFWTIVGTSFPEHIEDRFKFEHANQLKKVRDDERAQEALVASKIGAANDDRVAAYFLDGSGSLDMLVAQLQADYGLTEEESLEAINQGRALLSDEVSLDYDDE